MLDLEEIPQARPSRKRYSAILNMTVSDTDSQENENSNNENGNKEEASNENSSSSSNSEMDEDDRKKRKLQDTSLSPNSKTVKENSIRKKKSKSKKKKRIAIENDPRAPQGSPFLLVSENNREQIAAREATNTRQDTPTDPAAKKQRLFSHVPLPQRVKNRHHLEQIEKEKNSQSNENSPIELPKTPPGIIEPLRLSPRQSTPRTPVAVPIPISYSPTIAVTTEQ
ncbi:unnamed protein product, partial [Rotaria socialis]